MVTSRAKVISYRVLTWFAAFLAVCALFNFGAFTVYQNALKVKYSLTQNQVGLTGAFTELGLSTIAFTGYLCYRYGERITCALGLVLSTSAYTLIWLSTYHVDFHTRHYYLLYLYYLTAGVGTGVTTTAALSATNRQFKDYYFATVTGSITTCMNVGPLIYTASYNAWFRGDGSYETADLRSYFLYVTLTVLVTQIFGCFAFGLPQPEEEETEGTPLQNENTITYSSCSIGGNLNLHSRDFTLPNDTGELNLDSLPTVNDNIDINKYFIMSPWDMFKTARFQLILWAAAVVQSLKYFANTNVNIMLQSFGLTQYETTLPYLAPSSSIIGKTIIGVIVDATDGMFSRAWYLAIAGVLHVCFGLVAIWRADNIVFLSIAVVVWTFASDICMTVQPAINKDDFGLKNFAVNTGCTLGLFSTLMFVVQFLFGVTYSIQADPATRVCFGLACYTGVLVYSVIVSAASLLMVLIYFYIKYRR